MLIGFVLKSLALLNCQLFSQCLVSLMFNLVISFFSQFYRHITLHQFKEHNSMIYVYIGK